MDWKLTKTQWLFAVAYSSLFPVLGSMGGVPADVALYLNIPFLPIGWIGATAFVALFKTQGIYPIGLFLTILVQVVLVMMNLKYYFNQERSNAKKLLKRMALIAVFFMIGAIIIYYVQKYVSPNFFPSFPTSTLGMQIDVIHSQAGALEREKTLLFPIFPYQLDAFFDEKRYSV